VTPAPRALQRVAWSDVLYGAVVVAFTVAAARVWWLSTIVPGMDHPQFLVFVRVLQDHDDPTSPFHGTYSIASWLLPTSLPIQLTSLLARLCGHSIETAAKVLLTAQNVGLVAASAYLLRSLGRSRWAVVLVFPLVHSRWTITGGYFVFATALPLVVLGWALTVRWLRRPDARSGAALATCLSTTLLWHGIGYAVLGMGFAALWLLWRAPSARDRVVSVVPALPSLLQCGLWWATTFGSKTGQGRTTWMAPPDAAEAVFEYVWTSVPHARELALTLVALVAYGLVANKRNVGAAASGSRMWRADNPFAAVSAAYLLAYFTFPMNLNQVEGVASRFAYPAVLAFAFAWNLPGGRAARGLLVASVLAFSAFCLGDITQRFRAFHEDTRGASTLMDRIGLHETLYYGPTDRGVSKDFAPGHLPLRELQQYATARHGGLPNSSFAGYGCNYVGYVGGKNPMPGLSGPPRYGAEMTRFDYVLTRAGQGPNDPRFRLVDTASGWELYGVCGSARFPVCS
jgi:hypothetical protein